MSTDSPVALLDTNIWLDCYDAARPNHPDAQTLMDLLEKADFTIAYASTSIKDFYYLFCAEHKQAIRQRKGQLTQARAQAIQATAWGCLRNMTAIAVAVPIGEPQIWLAEHMHDLHGDFEDNLILAAVETSNADYFVTNDTTLLGKSACPAFTCADMLAFLQMPKA